MRNGWSQQVWIWLIVGIARLAGGLLLPLGGYGLPLIGIFTIIGADGMFIVARILTTVLTLGYLALVVNWVLQVFLKKENADPEQVERHALVLFWYPLVAIILIGFFSFFGFFATALHMAIMNGIYLWLAIWGTTLLIEHQQAGTLPDLMTTDY